MIKINLLAEKKSKAVKSPGAFKIQGVGNAQNWMLILIMALGFVIAGGWWWARDRELKEWKDKTAKAEAELIRLQDVRKKAESFKSQKEILEKKINLITDLKKKQTVPVHILDQISRNLPDFLWLDSMSAASNQISIAGKATTYNAVSNFFDNLEGSGQFTEVVLGKTAEVPEGVAFSLVCKYSAPAEKPAEATTAAPPQS